MLIPVSFEGGAQERLRAEGISLQFQGRFSLLDTFAVEGPCIIQAEIAPQNTFRFGAFSASYGGHLKHVEVGRYCSLAPGLAVGRDEHPTDWITSSGVAYVANHHGWEALQNRRREITQNFESQRGVTKIGNDAWVALNVFIRSGVTIGDGAIVGSGSVVTKDIPPYSVAVGNPAKVIRMRFKERVVERFMALQWWRYNIYDFPQELLSKPEDFIPYLEDVISAERITPYEPGWRGPKELGVVV